MKCLGLLDLLSHCLLSHELSRSYPSVMSKTSAEVMGANYQENSSSAFQDSSHAKGYISSQISIDDCDVSFANKPPPPTPSKPVSTFTCTMCCCSLLLPCFFYSYIFRRHLPPNRSPLFVVCFVESTLLQGRMIQKSRKCVFRCTTWQIGKVCADDPHLRSRDPPCR